MPVFLSLSGSAFLFSASACLLSRISLNRALHGTWSRPEQAVVDVESDHLGDRGPVQVGQDDDADAFPRQERHQRLEAVDGPAVMDPGTPPVVRQEPAHSVARRRHLGVLLEGAERAFLDDHLGRVDLGQGSPPK